MELLAPKRAELVSSCVFSAASAVTAAASSAVFTRFFRLADASRFVSRSILSTSVARESRSRYPRALATAPSKRTNPSRTEDAMAARFFWRAATRSISVSSRSAFLDHALRLRERRHLSPRALDALLQLAALALVHASLNVLDTRKSRTVMATALAS